MRRIGLILLVFIFASTTFNTVAAANLPASAFIQGFIGHPQSYSLSCESRSAVDWAAYWGVSLRESEFLASLPRSDNPDAGFVGDPNAYWGGIPPNSYGVHAKPVAALLRQAGFEAKAQHDMSWRDLRIEIAAGRPVIVWVIGQMYSGVPIEYIASDGHKTTIAYYEHTMTVVGYDQEHVQVVDSYSGLLQTYRRDAFMDSWKVLGRMAVTGYLESQPEPDTTVSSMVLRLPVVYRKSIPSHVQPTLVDSPMPEPILPDTYIVQPGDYLIALARQLKLDWYSLAVLNGLNYPYIIHPGQVLHLR